MFGICFKILKPYSLNNKNSEGNRWKRLVKCWWLLRIFLQWKLVKNHLETSPHSQRLHLTFKALCSASSLPQESPVFTAQPAVCWASIVLRAPPKLLCLCPYISILRPPSYVADSYSFFKTQFSLSGAFLDFSRQGEWLLWVPIMLCLYVCYS